MKAAIYARYSSDKQKPESIGQQVSVCTSYCERMGYQVAEVFSDSAASGRSDDRPQFQRMVAEASRFDVVVVYKLDRFARNRFDSASYKKRLKDAGCRLESATEATGDGIESVLLESLLEGMAEYYSKQLAQNTKRGMSDNAKRCKVNGSLPYGYKNEGGFYAVDEEEAEVVRMIFRLYAEGVPRVADRLSHLRTRRGGKFTPSIVSQIVRNERYLGIYEWGGTRVEGGIPRIVSDELWAAAVDRRGRRMRRREGSPMVLHGKLYGADGEPSRTQGTSHGGKFWQYYVVNGKYEEARAIEHEVAQAVRRAISDDEAVDSIVAAVLEAQAQEDVDGVEKAIEGQIEALEREKANGVAAIMAIGAQDDLVAAISERDARIKELEAELAVHRAKSRIFLSEDMVRQLLSVFKAEETDAGIIDIFVTFAVVDSEGLSVYCHWDNTPPTRSEVQAAVLAHTSRSEDSNWCPSYDLVRTVTAEALAVSVRR